jgi:hypothetical protein
VRLDRLALWLGPGTLTARGTADVRPSGPVIAAATLDAVTRRLLVAQEGGDGGLLTPRLTANADVRTDRLDARVRVHDAQLAMPAQPRQTVQDLAPDPARPSWCLGGVRPRRGPPVPTPWPWSPSAR